MTVGDLRALLERVPDSADLQFADPDGGPYNSYEVHEIHLVKNGDDTWTLRFA